MSYHKESSWKDDHFKCVDRGQEFVNEEDEAVTKWMKQKISRGNSDQ